MEFDWDEHNVNHIARHDVLPADAEAAMLNRPLHINTEFRGGEERRTYLGPDSSARMLVVVVTPRGPKTRVVTAFRANRANRAEYTTYRGDPK